MLTYWTPIRSLLLEFVTVPKTSIWQCLFADITYKTSMAWVLSPTPFLAWYWLNKVIINQVEGTVNRVWHWYNSVWLLSCITQPVLYLFYPELPMHFFAVWLLLVENVCIENNHVQAMHKEFLWPSDTFMQKTVVL